MGTGRANADFEQIENTDSHGFGHDLNTPVLIGYWAFHPELFRIGVRVPFHLQKWLS